MMDSLLQFSTLSVTIKVHFYSYLRQERIYYADVLIQSVGKIAEPVQLTTSASYSH